MSVETVLAAITAAWDAGDAAAFAAPFTADCTYVVFDGTVLHGRQAVEDVHRFLFDGPLKGSRLTPPPGAPAPEVTVREVGPGVVDVVNASGGIRPDDVDIVPDERRSVVSYVLVRQGAEWKVSAFQNTRRA
ncbi:SgcJ/EcaC family oxidoreductase [Pseudonocardia pini]|uniref:SgcJ/EcaC family oxidoreductase n=1 Tax=Pseudonocardia pini TaxID=2758030 RepID=UPI0015EFE515|nr:SgcJ/EcaC family oxidoreductase [Pseudonocardia pini]